ncbi:MAG TPA: hypothetical protein VF782_12280 [Allosphingosinicella sp.]
MLDKIGLRFRVGHAKLELLRTEVDQARSRISLAKADEGDRDWKAAATAALDCAATELDDSRYDSAWRHLHLAKRHEIFGYSATRLDIVARSLRDEVDAKLRGWRRLSALRLLDKLAEDGGTTESRREVLFEAMELRDGHHDNQYFKLRLVQKQVALLLKVLLVLVALFAILFWRKHAVLTSGASVGPAKLLAGIFVGAIGACFSGLLSLVSTSPSGTIPDRIANTTVTLARPAIGAVSGLAAILLLSAGLLGQLPTTTILAVAFAFGFSERLAIGALEKVGSR